MERTVRTRVGVSKTSTGKYSWDSTIEVTGTDLHTLTDVEAEDQQRIALQASDELVAELRQRYPGE